MTMWLKKTGLPLIERLAVIVISGSLGGCLEGDTGTQGPAGPSNITQIDTGPGLTGGPITTTGTIDLKLSTAGGLVKTWGLGSDELGIRPGFVDGDILSWNDSTIRWELTQQVPDAATLGGLGSAAYWQTGGNAGLTDDTDNFLGTSDAVPLRLITDGATRLYVDSTGEVGIGTVVPSSPLTVSGIIESTTGGIKFPDGTLQTTAAIAGGPDLPPVTLLTAAHVATGYFKANLQTTLDASGSYDPEGGTLDFAWDFMGTSTFTPFAAGGATQVVTFPRGPHLAAVRIRDAAGQIAEGKALVRNESFLFTVGSVEGSGAPSLAAVDGRPAVSYRETLADLKFAINTMADGSGAWTSTSVDVGQSPSLVIVDGRPAVSYTYYDGANFALKFAINALTDGSGSWAIVTVDSAGDVGDYSSLAVVDGRPAISYEDVTNKDLKFAINALADGSGAWTLTTVDGSGPGNDVGRFTSLAVVAGRPAISYFDGINWDMKFAINALADGSGVWAITIVDSAGNVGAYSSLAVVAGRPAISYSDLSNANLKFAINSMADGAGAWTLTTVDGTGAGNDVGRFTSLAVVGGRPAISYLDWTRNDLKFTINTLADGSGAWENTTVDSTGETSYSTSLAVVAGRAAIAYSDITHGKLKFAIAP